MKKLILVKIFDCGVEFPPWNEVIKKIWSDRDVLLLLLLLSLLKHYQKVFRRITIHKFNEKFFIGEATRPVIIIELHGWKMGQTRPLLVCFRPFLNKMTNKVQNLTFNGWSIVDVLGIRTHDRRMVGAGDSTELSYTVNHSCSATRWLDLFQYLAICRNEICPLAY